MDSSVRLDGMRHHVFVTGEERIEVHDQESQSAVFMLVRRHQGGVTIGFGIERNGDLDLTVTVDEALRLAEAIRRAARSGS